MTTETDTLTDEQRAWIEGLRELADFVEAHPEIDAASTFTLNLWMHEKSDLADWMKRLGGKWDKYTGLDAYFIMRRMFGPHRIELNANREAVCERTQVGTKTVEKPDPELLAAVPLVTVEEPVYEWKCPDSLLAEAS